MASPAPSLLLTRPTRQADRFAEALRADWNGALDIVISPVLRIVPRRFAIDPAEVGTILFTSENAVAQVSPETGLAGFPALCVGQRTAEAARMAGFKASGAGKDVEALIDRVRKTGPRPPLVHLRGAHTTGDLAARLSALGHPARDIVVYDQTPVALSPAARRLLAGPGRMILPLFSPRSARLLRDAAGKIAAPHTAIALSPAVAGAWSGDIRIAARPDAEAMIAAIVEVLREDSAC